MAFAVICKSCQARFLLNDDLLRRKVAGRVVTVRCRQCHAPIEVDASNVDPKTLPQEHEAMVAPPPAPPEPPMTPVKPKAARPAPSPPRPTAKSTLMGIGGPPRPQGATEMIALSPGLLGVASAEAPAPRGFPEPPPPPLAADVVEELEGDWEVKETPTLSRAEAAPESLDDFAEELPPSLPPEADDELPSSTGTPSLDALTHHDVTAPARPRSDDFLANMNAAMNGGVMGSALGAPTIDVSTLSATGGGAAPDVDLSTFDVPLSGKQTLPLFSLADDEAKTPTPGIVGKATASGAVPAPRRPPAPRAAEGSLSPAAVDAPATDSSRERRHVVPPATKSVPPPASAPRRSGLAAPLLLVVAAAAGFLIWKRTSAPVATPTEAEKPAPLAQAPEPPLPPAAQPPSEPVAATSAAAADDVSFDEAPSKPPAAQPPQSGAAAGEPKTTREPAASEPSAPRTPEASSSPAPKEDPKPAAVAPETPTEPAGPFDRAAAASALSAGATQASACRKEGDPSGVANVVITFAPSGRVTTATIGGPPFAGTPTGGCIAAALRQARIPPFEGERVTVSKTIVVQ